MSGFGVDLRSIGYPLKLLGPMAIGAKTALLEVASHPRRATTYDPSSAGGPSASPPRAATYLKPAMGPAADIRFYGRAALHTDKAIHLPTSAEPSSRQ